MLQQRLKTDDSTSMVAQARVSLAQSADLSEKSTRLLRVLSIITGGIGLAAASIIAAVEPDHGLWAVFLGFLAGAVLFRRLPASDVFKHIWTSAQVNSQVEQLPGNSEDAQDADWQLREADDRHRSVLDAMGAIVIRCDASGTVLSINEAGLQAFPRGAGVDVGRVINLPYAPNFTPDLEDATATVAEDVALQTSQGPRWYSILRLSVRDGSGGAPIIQWILTDVSERRDAEQKLRDDRISAENASQAKSQFLAMVSHEIRTPLNGVLGMAGLLEDTSLSAEQTNYIEAIKTSGSTLLMLIDEVLDYSKIEAGKLILEPQPVDLVSLAERVVELLAPKAHAKQLEIGSFISPKVPAEILGDPDRLQQVLYNLLGNAIKFTESGGVSLVLDTKHSASGLCELVFSVKDTGPGMDPVTAKRIFREFEQGDYGRDRKFGGAGLGLAISRRLAELMGGRLDVDSQVGMGSTFHLTMPIDVRPLPEIPVQNLRIAILSDNTLEADLILRSLRAHGFSEVHRFTQADTTQDGHPTPSFDRLLVSEDALPTLQNLQETGSLACKHVIVLIKPTERALKAQSQAGPYAGYLTRPVRRSSLLRFMQTDLQLPVKAEVQKAKQQLAPVQLDSETAQPLQILVAEDNPINWMLMNALITKSGHHAVRAENGKQAVEMSQTGRFDLVLMDLHMPGLDGLEALSRIRGSDETSVHSLPVYVVSADVMLETRSEAEQAGANGFLSKPLQQEDLLNLLKIHSKS